jgi:predicted nucleic acid-binding protein
MFLLDTDALSELEKPLPDRGLTAWLESNAGYADSGDCARSAPHIGNPQ